MFVDDAVITVKGGHGGTGAISFGKKMGSGPDGGNGGRGGDVYLTASPDLTLLNQFSAKTLFSAENGEPGGRNRRSGKDGNDIEIKLPVGTTIINKKDKTAILEMVSVGQKELVAKGGKGGRGNFEFRSPRRTTPEYAQPGLPGESYEFKLILKLIADYGFIGLPNAGKSSLLNEITNANVKTANYAFTTLSPNLGIYKGNVLADIPGLIEGASTGRGLGISFLKHIEKVHTLLHCLSAESVDPQHDYQAVRKELGEYNKELLTKPEKLVITKTDLAEENKLNSIKQLFGEKKLIFVSIYDWDSLEELKNYIEK